MAIIKIYTGCLLPHPDNPRKDLGDLEELTDSIKKRGIMQNLTIIPKEALELDPEDQVPATQVDPYQKFYVLIGHRRLAAARKAGVLEVPCKIVSKLSRKDQIAIMLEENMQRNDLTIWEQAHSFQLMLDLGDTAEQIAEKTGFSKSTIHHRLNIAKLDQEVLQKKEQSFQLSIMDMYSLEKIKDLKRRNKVLQEATSSSHLASLAAMAVKEEKRAANTKIILDFFKKIGLKKANDKERNSLWDSAKFSRILNLNLETDELPHLEGDSNFKDVQDLRYSAGTYNIAVYKKRPPRKKDPEETAQEKKEREFRKRVKEIDQAVGELCKEIEGYVKEILKRNIPYLKKEEEPEAKDALWKLSMNAPSGRYAYPYNIREFLKKNGIEKATVLDEMLVSTLLSSRLETWERFSNSAEFDKTTKERATELLKFCKVLNKFGNYFSGIEENPILAGTSELYIKREEGEEK